MRVARWRSKDSWWLAVAGLFGLAQHPGRADAGGSKQTDEPADLQTDLGVGVPRLPEDDSIQEDQHERRHPDDHRDLARAPGQRMSARDDPGEDERRGA